MKKVILIALVAFLSSCSKFSYSVKDIDSTTLYVTMSQAPGGSAENYIVMMSRLVSSIHYVCHPDTALKVDCGEYYAAIFRADESAFEIKGLEAFRRDPSVSMQEVYACLHEGDEEEVGDMASFNAYSSFVTSADATLVVDFQKASFIDSAAVMCFTPRSLTQRLTFSLKVRSEQGVAIESLHAAVSGVPGKVRLMSGLIRNDEDNPTYRQVVDMKVVGMSEGAQVYEGTTSVLGLFPPTSSKYASGPGIFQVCMQASVMQDGVLKRRTFHVGINLKDVIAKAGLMEQAADCSGYRVIKSKARIDVPVILTVDVDKITSSAGEGLVEWVVNDDDIEVDV